MRSIPHSTVSSSSRVVLLGLRDTVLVRGMDTVTLVTNFDNPGEWMVHCHILEHAELGMMTTVTVEP